MGLDISHGTWHGAYSAFHRWRQEIAKVAGLPPLMLMEGFYSNNGSGPFGLLDYKFPKGDELEMSQVNEIRQSLPIKWESLKRSPLYELLCHSDCDGYINWKACGAIASELEKLLPKLEGDGGGHIGSYKEKTEQFIKGLRLAYKKKEKLLFQ